MANKKTEEGKGYVSSAYNESIGRLNYGRLYAKHIHQRYFKKRGKLLDIGCGRCWYLQGFKELGYEVYGLDYDEESVKEGIRKGFNLKKCKAGKEKFPHKDNSFDFIFCKSVIEHIYPQDIFFFVEEIYRVLKSGGKIYFLTPNWKKTWKSFYDSPSHFSPFTKERLKHILAFAKFKKIKVGVFDNLPFLWRYDELAFLIPRWLPWSEMPRNIFAVAEK